MLTLVIGGAHNGKSRFAQSQPADSRRVVYLAAARCEYAEMAARIGQHRRGRPAQWMTIEEPLENGAAQRHAGDCECVPDCLTISPSHISWAHRESDEANFLAAVAQEVVRLVAAPRRTHVVAVTTALACGRVPESPVGPLFRDSHGRINQAVARAADLVYHMVVGIAISLKPPEALR